MQSLQRRRSWSAWISFIFSSGQVFRFWEGEWVHAAITLTLLVDIRRENERNREKCMVSPLTHSWADSSSIRHCTTVWKYFHVCKSLIVCCRSNPRLCLFWRCRVPKAEQASSIVCCVQSCVKLRFDHPLKIHLVIIWNHRWWWRCWICLVMSVMDSLSL